MVRKIIRKINDWLEYSLRRVFAPLSRDARVVVIFVMMLVFGGLSVWMTFSSIYNLGRDKEDHIRMEHIERLQLELRQQRQETDSLKHLNQFEYGKK